MNNPMTAREDGLLARLIECRDWFDQQADVISKGSGSTWDLLQCREQRDLCNEALATPGAGAAGQGEIRLFDGQWVNIVNHPDVLNAESQEDAVSLAVKMTEQAIAKNVADGKLPEKRTTALDSAGNAQGDHIADAGKMVTHPVAGNGLWCLHLEGPDDVYPAPSKAHAQKAVEMTDNLRGLGVVAWQYRVHSRDEGWGLWRDVDECHVPMLKQQASAEVRELVLATDYAAAIARAEAERMQSMHLRRVNDRLIKLFSSIHMRCAPADTVLEDGRVMQFVPPDPEFYWRELSAKVNSAWNEMRDAIEAENTYEAAIAAMQEGAVHG